jgi:hypothetical protein
MKNKIILLISPEGWGTNFVSKHHYANYLAKHNTVYFLNPVNNSIINLFGNVNAKVEKIKDNLYQVNYQNLLPRLNVLPKFIQQYIFKKQAKQIQKTLQIKQFDIVWSFDPYRFWNQKVWQTDKTIYHTVDFHPKAKFEKEICQTSNHVIGVTPLVIDSIKGYKKLIHRIGHGADIDNFTFDESISIPGKNTIKACYTGNFHKHIDYDILLEIAKSNSTIDFIMIGPTINNNLSSGSQINKSKYNELKKMSNIFLIGSVPSNKLMSYLCQCQINLVLFKKEYETIHCSPHKLMAYFYSGNVTISNYIDEHKNTSSDIIIMVKDINKISSLIQQIKQNINKFNSNKLKDKRRQFAISNSYNKKIEEINKIIYD